jgi:hypothetical protein
MAKNSEVNEKIWQDQVVTLAKMNGWQVFHPTPHQVRPGVFRSDGAGFPDLVLAHKDRGLIFAELKTERGKVSAAQKVWALNILPHAEWYLWRPSQLELIAERLGRKQVIVPHKS